MAKYNYSFAKGRKGICPQCGRRTLTLYKDNAKGVLMPDKYGKCERVNNCGYWQRPEAKEKEFFIAPIQQPKETSYISNETVNLTLGHYDSNVLFNWMLAFAEREKLKQVFDLYRVGTAKDDGVIYWQTDYLGRIRTGKLMYYLKTGKRNKKKFGTWVHTLLKLKDFNLKQTLFGIHLLNDLPHGETILIVESEKTALLMLLTQGVITLATGGSSNLGLLAQNRNILKNYKLLVAPDIGEIWAHKNKQGQTLQGWSEKLEEMNIPFAKIYNWWEEFGINPNAPEHLGNDIGDYIIN